MDAAALAEIGVPAGAIASEPEERRAAGVAHSSSRFLDRGAFVPVPSQLLSKAEALAAAVLSLIPVRAPCAVVALAETITQAAIVEQIALQTAQ